MLHRAAGFFRLTPRELVGLVVVFLLTLPAVTTRIYSSDEVQYFSYLRSLWFDRDVSFENEYRYFYEHNIAQTPDFHKTFLVLKTDTGRRINFGTLGSAILWSPFYAVADAGARLARAAGSDTPADGFSKPYVAAVAYGSAVYGFFAVLLGLRAARLLLGSVSLVPAIAVWIGTPLLFYMYVAPPFAHATSAFAVALFITVWLHVRGAWTTRGVVLLGLAAALMTMVREQDVFLAAGPALDFARDAVRARGAMLRARAIGAAAGVAAFVAGWLPQLLAYQILNGRPGPSPLVTRKMYWHSPHALQVLFDANHGFIAWTPLALFAIGGLVMLAARSHRPAPAGHYRAEMASSDAEHEVRWIGGVLLIMLLLQIYVSGAVDSWTVAGAFGQRRFVAVTAILIVGLSALWHAATAGKMSAAFVQPLLAALVALCVWWNIGLMALFGTRMMDRQRVEIARNAYDVFVTLPLRAPELAWRYFAARDSFYQPRPPAGQ